MIQLGKLIGKGPKFPFEPNGYGGVASSELVERINQSLSIIFDTRKGSRLNMPEFGSTLYKYRFEPFDNILIEKLREIINEDIRRWEPRIRVNDIRFLDSPSHRDSSSLYISVHYTILNTSVEGNFVYPFRKDVYSMSSNSSEEW